MSIVHFDTLFVGQRFVFSFDVQDGINRWEYVKIDHNRAMCTKCPIGSSIGIIADCNNYSPSSSKCIPITDDNEKKEEKKPILKVWNSGLSKFEETETSNMKPFIFSGYTVVLTSEDRVYICKDEEAEDVTKHMTKLFDMIS